MRRKMKPDSKIDDKTYDLEQNKHCTVEKSFGTTFWVTFNAILQKRLYSASKNCPESWIDVMRHVSYTMFQINVKIVFHKTVGYFFFYWTVLNKLDMLFFIY